MRAVLLILFLFSFSCYGQIIATYYNDKDVHVYDTSTVRLMTQMPFQQTQQRKILIDSTIRKLKTAGIWDKLDVLYVFAAADTGAAKVNWKPSAYSCSLIGSLTFITDKGFKTSTNKYINSNYDFSTAANKFKSLDASFGGWIFDQTNDQNLNYNFGASNVSSGNNAFLTTYYNSGGRKTVVALNTASNVLGSGGFAGLFSFSRRGANKYIVRYRDGVYVDSTSSEEKGTPSGKCYIGCLNSDGTATGFSTNGISLFFAGAGLTNAQQVSLYTIINAYLSAVDYREIFSQSKMQNSIVLKQESGYQRKTPFGSIKFFSPGKTVYVKAYPSLYEIIPAYSFLRVEENDSKIYTYYPCYANDYIRVTLSGPNKIVEITEPFSQSNPGTIADLKGDFLTSIKILYPYSAYSPIYYPSTPSRKLVFMGNSINAGLRDATDYGFKGFSMLFRNNKAPGCDVSISGFSNASIAYIAPDSTNRMIWANVTDSLMNASDTNKLVIMLGVCDFEEFFTDTTNFKNWYSILLNDIHNKRSDIKICVISPLLLSASEDQSGSRKCSLGGYRDIIRRICLGRSYVTFIDGTTLLAPEDLSYDHVHPTSAGHLKLYNNLKALSFFVSFVN